MRWVSDAVETRGPPDAEERTPPRPSSAAASMGRMDQRISFITLAVHDLAASRRFYLDGLGWSAELDVPGEVLMIRAGEHLVLSLWDIAAFEAEVGKAARGEGVPPLTLAHNVHLPEQVDRILERAREIGAAPVEGPVRRDWGGYSGYFADPDGYRWEIAVNPGPIGELVLPDDGGS